MFRKLIKEQLLMEADEIRLPFKMDIPEDIRKIQKVFKSNGKELFLVGGSVRDALLGKPIKEEINGKSGGLKGCIQTLYHGSRQGFAA